MHLIRGLQNTFKKLIELQREIDKSTVVIGYVNTLRSVIMRRNKHQISKDTFHTEGKSEHQ